MRLLATFTVVMLTAPAWADDNVVITPEAGKPDVVYVGKDWPANFTDGCVDRGECKLPELEAERGLPTASRGKGGFVGGSGGDCSGAVQGTRDIAGMYQLVTRCIAGN